MVDYLSARASRRRPRVASRKAAALPNRVGLRWGRGGRMEDMASAPVLPDGLSVDVARMAEVCQRYGVEELAVFGSVARGETSADSDVDLLYVLVPGARLGFALNRLEDELAGIFGRPVDLVSRKALHPLLRDAVEAEAYTLYTA